MSIASRFLRSFVKLYQWCLSPWLGTNCRFEPSCSHYALESLQLHGAGKGAWLTIKRLLRCHPLARAGYDPVPTKQ